MSTFKLRRFCCGFSSVEVGEFFQWGSKGGEIYVKIKVQRHRTLSDAEKREGKHIFDIPESSRFIFSFAALNIRTFETCYDIDGGNLQCVRLRGHMAVEVH